LFNFFLEWGGIEMKKFFMFFVLALNFNVDGMQDSFMMQQGTPDISSLHASASYVDIPPPAALYIDICKFMKELHISNKDANFVLRLYKSDIPLAGQGQCVKWINKGAIGLLSLSAATLGQALLSLAKSPGEIQIDSLIAASAGIVVSSVVWGVTFPSVRRWNKKEKLYQFLTDIGYPKDLN
jgi:hypothetical protein